MSRVRSAAVLFSALNILAFAAASEAAQPPTPSPVVTPTEASTTSSTVPDTLPPEQPPTTTTTTVAPTTTTTGAPTATTTPAQPDLTNPTLAGVCASSGNAELRAARPCRVIAYYGTPLSTRMGILGRLPRTEVMPSLRATIDQWDKADPETDHQCAFEVIAVTAQGSPGPGGLYRARIPAARLNEMITLARANNCLTLLDIQVGHSNVAAELPYFATWLAMPDVHLALDPEWDMPPGVKPGSRIGSMDSADINVAVKTLQDIVRASNVGPKLLVVHRFRDFMVQRPELINDVPEVRLLVNMDGFGPPRTKLGSYRAVRRGLTTNLTGFKLFTINDRPMLKPEQVISLTPSPMFINYQ